MEQHFQYMRSVSVNRFQKQSLLVILVAGGLLQIPMARAIKRLGYLLAVVDNDESCITREIADIFYVCNIRSDVALLDIARLLKRTYPIAFAITAATDFSRQVAAINRSLSLSTVPLISTATITTDKSIMRSTLQQRRVRVPWFSLIQKDDDFHTKNIPLPVVVKPIDNMGGRGVRLVSSSAELAAAIRVAKSYSQKKTILCEQYVTAPEYSVEMLVRNYRPFAFAIAERYIHFRPFFIEMGHLLPSTISLSASLKIRSACKTAIRAIGLRDGVAKFDLFYQYPQVTIGEIACRLSGGYMSGWTFPQAYGSDLNERYIRILERFSHQQKPTRFFVSRSIPTRPLKRNTYSGECAMLSIPGQIATLNGIATAQQLSGVTHVFKRCHSGDDVSFPTNNVEKCLNIIITAKNTSDFWSTAHSARSAIDIRLVAADKRTLAFLFTNDGFQFPMAYPLSHSLLAYLKTQLDNRHLSVIDVLNLSLSSPPILSRLVDWHMYSLQNTIDRLYLEYKSTSIPDQSPSLGRAFLRAILKGGLQGGRFFFDTLKEQSNLLNRWIEKWDGNISDG